jgi:hypothetical protein
MVASREFCPQCGQARTGAFRFCRSCGLDYDALAMRPTVAPAAAAAQPQAARPAQPGIPASPPEGAKAKRSATTRILGFVAFLVAAGLIIWAIPQIMVPDYSLPNIGDTADLPPAGTAWFGSSFDRDTFELRGRTTTVGTNEPFAMVAHLSEAIDGSQMMHPRVFR